MVAGIRITHPDRVLFPAARLTKLDMARYYEQVAEWMLPHLRGRPLTLKQCAPDADHCRYLRHSGNRAPADVRVVNIQEKTKVGDYMIVDDRRALVGLAQRNIIEFHVWNATVDRLEYPDRLVFDLDPGPRVPWSAVVEAARRVRAELTARGLRSWVKTTGGKGLHVLAPLAREHGWDECLAFARDLATEVAGDEPARYTVRFARRGREDKILIDYLRNNRTNTSVCAYSVRARPTATVSVPLAWDELSTRSGPDRWTMTTVPRRVRQLGGDPWTGFSRAAGHLRR